MIQWGYKPEGVIIKISSNLSVGVPLMQFSPSNLLKLTPKDAQSLSEYIKALENENKCKDEERQLMEGYMNSMKAEVEALTATDKDRRGKEKQMHDEIGRLYRDYQHIIEELKGREFENSKLLGEIEQLRNELNRLASLNASNEQVSQQKIRQLSEQSAKMQARYETLLQDQVARSKAEYGQLQEKLNGFVRNYDMSQAQNTNNEHRISSLQEQNAKLRAQITIINQTLSSQSEGSLSRIKQLEEEVEKLRRRAEEADQEKAVLSQQLKRERDVRQSKQYLLEDVSNNHSRDQAEWAKKQKDLEEFVHYVKNNVAGLEATIEEQNIEISILKKTNSNLKSEILESITKFSLESDAQREIGKLKEEVANYKGKLAQHSRQASVKGSLVWNEVDDEAAGHTYAQVGGRHAGTQSQINNIIPKSRQRVKKFVSQNEPIDSSPSLQP